MFALLFISFEESDAIKQNMNCRPNLFCQYQYRIIKMSRQSFIQDKTETDRHLDVSANLEEVDHFNIHHLGQRTRVCFLSHIRKNIKQHLGLGSTV